jgi:hypothetical protein
MADKNLPGRARVIYQSEALYAGTVDATGYHFADGNVGKATDVAGVDKTGIQQLRRVQSANYSFSINRQDVNQFGQLARVDSVSIEPPTVTLDFSYYLTNGINERLLGMNVSGKQSALSSEIMDGVVCGESVNAAGKNFFILTTCEGKDAVGADTTSSDNKSVIALGNGFVSNYSIEAAVGGMPTANVTVDGLNLKSYTGCKDLEIPAVNTNYGTPITDVKFSIPPAVSGVLNDSATDTDAESEGWSCLRPGDITLSLGTDGRAAEFELLPGEDPRASDYGNTVKGKYINAYPSYEAGTTYALGDIVQNTGVSADGPHLYKSLTASNATVPTGQDSNWDLAENQKFDDGTSVSVQDNPQKDYSVAGSAHIQSFSIDVPLSRSVLNRLGSPYGYSRVVDYPVNISISVNAILADLKKGDVAELLWNTEEHDLVFTMREPAQMGDGPVAMQYVVKGALLEGESFSSSIGDNKSVDLTFTAQVGAPDDKARGLFILGSRNALDVENLPGWYSG